MTVQGLTNRVCRLPCAVRCGALIGRYLICYPYFSYPSLNSFQRPAWSTGILIPGACLCGVFAGVFIWRGGQKTKRTEEVEKKLRMALATGHLPGGNPDREQPGRADIVTKPSKDVIRGPPLGRMKALQNNENTEKQLDN
jgi:hypothetical protein